MLIRLDVWQIKTGGPAAAQPSLKCQRLVISHQQSPEMVHRHTRNTLTHSHIEGLASEQRFAGKSGFHVRSQMISLKIQ